jgi:hypothetical protein
MSETIIWISLVSDSDLPSPLRRLWSSGTEGGSGKGSLQTRAASFRTSRPRSLRAMTLRTRCTSSRQTSRGAPTPPRGDGRQTWTGAACFQSSSRRRFRHTVPTLGSTGGMFFQVVPVVHNVFFDVSFSCSPLSPVSFCIFPFWFRVNDLVSDV